MHSVPARTGPPLNGTEPCVHLQHWLPINLRSFLAAELGSALRVEANAIYWHGHNVSDHQMRDLARAIRRFSFKRVQERWVECSIAGAELASQLEQALKHQRPIVLCLLCARLESGQHARANHRGKACFAVELTPQAAPAANGDGEPANHARALVHHGLYQTIEEFRRRREEAKLPHFELDYFAQGDQVVFTWRPLPRN